MAARSWRYVGAGPGGANGSVSSPGSQPPEPWILDLDLGIDLGAGLLEVALKSHARTLAIVGPSGGGKSTLLRVLAGVERRARGKVSVEGEVWQSSADEVFRPPWERGVGWVPQDYLLFPHLRVRQNLAFAGASREEVTAMAERLGVAELLARRPRGLSGGERQRVALGRALLARPRLLLLDEPFSALDRPLRARVGEEIASFCRSHEIPMVLVSHDEADAAALAREHWLLSGGALERVRSS